MRAFLDTFKICPFFKKCQCVHLHGINLEPGFVILLYDYVELDQNPCDILPNVHIFEGKSDFC